MRLNFLNNPEWILYSYTLHIFYWGICLCLSHLLVIRTLYIKNTSPLLYMILIFYPVFLFVCNLILGMFSCRDILIVMYTSPQSFMVSTLLDPSARKYFSFLEKLILLPLCWLFSQIFINLNYIEGQDAIDSIESWLNIIIFSICYRMCNVWTYLLKVKPGICDFTWHSSDAVWKSEHFINTKHYNNYLMKSRQKMTLCWNSLLFFVIGWVCLFCLRTEPLQRWSVSEQVPFLLSR